MSQTIDTRVVEMKFDNSDFEKKTKDSLDSLEKMNKSLDALGGNKGLSSLQQEAKNFSMESMADSISVIEQKFSALGIMGTTILADLANSAYQAGMRMVKSFTRLPTDGFKEYELKMDSVKTILASTRGEFDSEAEALAYVNQKLDELNTYSDRTIYSFSDMTQNIGKFTNAGVKLDDAVAAIQGISNEAALSGANANEASRAMYNFSQALSAGYVKLIDWKSIENANMATVEFKQELLNTALELGNVEKTADGMYQVLTTNANGSTMDYAIDATHAFNESLSYQWMTSDVLTKTLARYADETTDVGKRAFAAAEEVTTFTKLIDTLKEAVGSGWANTFQLIFGDFNEAKKMWTSVNNVLSGIIGRVADYRNAILQTWHDKGGRDSVLAGISNIYKAITNIVTPIKNAWREIFPAWTGDFLVTISKGFENLTSKLIISEKSVKKIKSAFTGLFSILGLFVKIVKTIVGLVTPLIKDVSGTLFNGLKKILGAALELINFVGKTAGKITGFVSGLFDIKSIIDGIRESISKKLLPALESIKDLHPIQWIKDLAKTLYGRDLAKYIANLKTSLEGMKDSVVPVVDRIIDIFSKLIKFITSKIGPAFKFVSNTVINTWDKIKNSEIYKAISGFVSELVKEKIPELVRDIRDSIINFLNEADGRSVPEIFKDLYVYLKESLSSINDIVKNKAIVSFSKAADNMSKGMDTLNNVGEKVNDTYETFKTNLMDLNRGVYDFMGGNQYVLNIDTFSKILRDLFGMFAMYNVSKLTKAFSGLSSSLVGLIGSFSKMNAAEAQKTKSEGIKNLAIAIAILAGSLFLLSKVPVDKLWNSVAVLVVIGGALAGFAVLVGKFVQTMEGGGLNAKLLVIGVALSLIGFAAVELALSVSLLAGGIALLGLVIKEYATLVKQGSFRDGMDALKEVIEQILDIFITFGNNSKHGLSNAIGIFIMVGALAMLAGVLKVYESMDPDTITIGVGKIKEVLIQLSDEIKNLMPKSGKGLIKYSVYLVALAAFLYLVKGVIKGFAKIDQGDIDKGIAAIKSVFEALTFLMYSLAALSLTGPLGTIKTVGVLAELPIVLVAISGVVMALGNMEKDKLKQGVNSLKSILFSIVAAITILGLIPSMKGKNSGLESIKSLAFTIAAITAAIMILGNMKSETLARGVAALSLVLIEVLGMALIMNKLGTSFGNTNLPQMLVSIGVIVAIALAIAVLAKLPMANVAVAAASLSGAILAIGVALKGMSAVNGSVNKKSAIAILEVIVIVGAIAGALYLLSGRDWKSLLGAATSISEVLVVITGMVAVLSKVPTNIGGVVKGLEGIGIVLGAVLVVGLALGAIFTEIPQLETWLVKAGDVFELLGSAIGKLVGGFIGGISYSVLSQTGAGLTAFAENASGFFEAIAGVDSETLKATKYLGEAILYISGAGLLDALAGLFGARTDYETLSKGFTELGKGLSGFATETAEITPEKVEPAAKALKDLCEIDIPRTGGFVGMLLGNKDLTSFGTGLGAMGSGLKNFAREIENVGDWSAVDEGLDRIKRFAAIDIPNGGTDTFFGWLTGTQDLSDFASDVEAIGGGIYNFYDKVKDISDFEVVRSATMAIGWLSTIKAPDKDGIIYSKLETFANDLASLGSGISSFADSVDGKDFSESSPSRSAVNFLNAFTTSLPKGDVISELDEFVYALGETGKNLSDFSDKVGSVDQGSLNAAITNLNSLGQIALTEEDTANINAIADALSKLANDGVNAFTSVMSNDETVGSAISKFLNNAVSAVNNNNIHEKFKEAGDSCVNKFKQSLDNSTEPKKAGQKVANEAVSGIASYNGTGSGSFYRTGQYAVQGFVNGMNSMIYKAADAAAKVAKAAKDSAARTLEEQSPSKAMFRIGDFAVKGFVNAFLAKRSIRSVENSASALAQASIDAIGDNSDISKNASMLSIALADAINSDIDDAPTITPILDLSNIQNNAALINGIIGNTKSMELAANISTAGITSGERRAADNQERLFTAIHDLTRQTEANALDMAMMYDAVREGASNAKFKIQLNNRELTRGLKDLGVVMR